MKRAVREFRLVIRMMQRMLDVIMTLSRRQIAVAACAAVLVLSVFIAMPARAAVSFRSAATGQNGAGTTSLTISKPAGLQEGDLMVAILGQRDSNSFTQPSGWTFVNTATITTSVQQVFSWRIATSADVSASSYTWTISTATKASGTILAYSGAHQTSPINTSTTTVGSTATASMSANAISPTVANTMIIAGFTQASAATFTGGSSMTLQSQITNTGGGAAGTKGTTGAQDITQAATGTTGAKTMTSSVSATYVAHTIAIAPAPPSTLTQSAYRWFTNVDAGNFSSITSNPTTGTDAIYAAANDSSYMYTAGYVSSNGNDWRIEKRNLSDGALVSGFGTGGVVDVNISVNDDRAWGIEQDASAIYISGQDATGTNTNTQWRIEKRDKTTGALVSGFGSGGVIQVNPTSSLDNAKELKVDDSYLYVVGYDNTGAGSWRIEKRDKTTGALVSGFGSGGVIVTDYAATVNDEATSIVMDTNSLYIGGFDRTTGASNSQWRIEKRDKTTGALVSGFGSGGAVTANPFTGNAGSVIEDGVVNHGLVISGGALYATGSQGVTGSTDMQWRTEKRDMTTGALVSGFGTGGVVNSDPGTNIDNPTSIRADGTSLYIAGFDRTQDAGMSQWRTEKRDMTTGALVSGFGTGGVVANNPSTNHDEVRDLVVSGNNIFSLGYDVSPGNYQMRIEKRNTINGNGPSDDNSPVAALNTTATAVAVNDKLRLRMLLRVGTSILDASGQQFKLQFSQRSGTCDTAFSGETYADVTTTTAIAYSDNTVLADATAAYMNINDPTDGANPVVLQAYEEANNFTSTAAVPIGSNGLWEFSLYNRSAPNGTTYCFRAVDSAGAVVSSYLQIPELTTAVPVTFTQANYRWYQNTNASQPGAALAAQDVGASVAVQAPFRLRQRIAVDSNPLAQASQNFKLQYAEKSGVCDVSFSGESYQDLAPAITSTAYASPTTAVNDGSTGVVAWTNAANVLSSDNSYATASLNSQQTNYMKVTGLGLSVPGSATITGIEMRVEAGANAANQVSFSSPRIVKGGAIVGNFLNHSTGFLTTTDQTYLIGGQNDTGGQTLTPTDVNSTDFGVVVSLLDDVGMSTVSIDHIQVRVYYNLNAPVAFGDNASVTDGAAIAAVADDPTNGARATVLQSYEESNSFSNAVGVISTGSDGLWDFALTSNSGASGKAYCLRIVKNDNSLLDAYSQIPEITITGLVPPTLNQQLRGGQSVIDGVKRFFSW